MKQFNLIVYFCLVSLCLIYISSQGAECRELRLRRQAKDDKSEVGSARRSSKGKSKDKKKKDSKSDDKDKNKDDDGDDKEDKKKDENKVMDEANKLQQVARKELTRYIDYVKKNRNPELIDQIISFYRSMKTKIAEAVKPDKGHSTPPKF